MDEMRNAVRELIPRTSAAPNEEAVTAMLRDIDADNDGFVSFLEFTHFVATTELDRIAEIIRNSKRPFTLVFSRPRE
jgi:Ca2+-binding EF-hand superfamily protein